MTDMDIANDLAGDLADLSTAAAAVIRAWEHGDLAAAVRELAAVLADQGWPTDSE